MKEQELQRIVKMAVDAWQTQNTRVDKLLEALSDEQLAREIAPGRNTGTYLLGHLLAVNDNLFPLFGFGDKLYPQLEDVFLKSPDKSGKVFPSTQELKKCWNEVNSKLLQQINALPPAAWLTRHTAVSESDFAKEPHRNKLNVLLNRTTHQSYHLGQMMLLK
jgi:hypothetical protein